MYTLYHGDCLIEMDKIPDKSINMVLTDIPYDVVNRVSGGLRNLDKGVADIKTFNLDDFLSQLSRVTKGSVYVFCSTEQVSFIRKRLDEQGMTTRLGIWEKTNPSPMNGEYMWLSSVECCVYGRNKGAVFTENCKSSVWRYPTVRGKIHPTEKPVALLERLINASSNIGDTVLDACMGSGSTGVACVKTKRKFIGIELYPLPDKPVDKKTNPNYFFEAQERIKRELNKPKQEELK